MKVLIVDYSQEDRESLSALLTSWFGAEVSIFTASSTQAAGEAIFAHQPLDVIVSDWDLGEASTGYDLMVDLEAEGKNIPLILMTDHDPGDRETQAMDAGARAFIIKSADFEDLKRELETILLER